MVPDMMSPLILQEIHIFYCTPTILGSSCGLQLWFLFEGNTQSLADPVDLKPIDHDKITQWNL